MTLFQQIITIALVVLGTMITRFLPFYIFSPNKPTPSFVRYLGKALPAAVFGLLVVYSFKDVNILKYSFGLPELIATVVIIGLHLVKRSMLLSIAGGTSVYMLLVQFVF